MPNRPPILTDIDGVLLDWCGAFSAHVRKKLGKKIEGCVSDVYSVERWLGVSKTEADALLSAFNGSEALAELPAFPDAKAAVAALAERGFRFVAVTAVSDDRATRQRRAVNLRTAFGDVFDEVIHVGRGGGKDDALRRFPPSFWIDDIPAYAVAGRDAGHRAMLIERPYNKNEIIEGVRRVTDWSQIVSAILHDGRT
jgi:FMN phosphatase YigB (HAD superfamily)